MESVSLLSYKQDQVSQRRYRRMVILGVVLIIVGLVATIIALGVLYNDSHNGSDMTLNGRMGFPSHNSTSYNMSSLTTSTSSTNYSTFGGDNACYAPPGVWGAPCSSNIGFNSPYGNAWIYYHIEASENTAVFCKVSGAACPSGGPCCFDWHPRTDAGNPVWNGPIPMIWGATIGTPQIICMGSPLGSAIRWSWTSGIGNLGCFNGYNCRIMGC